MINTIIENELKPKVDLIDRYGVYPESILRNLGKTGLYNLIGNDDSNVLLDTVFSIASVSRVCATTGFCACCQSSLAWYLIHTDNASLRDSILLENVVLGNILGGTGLSNPLKAYSRIEKNHLTAKMVSGGYVISGTLPWVSNVEYGHIFSSVFDLVDEGHNIMGIIRCDSDKVTLKFNHKFCAMNGSATKSVVLNNYFMPHDDVLADAVEPYLANIIPGSILLQVGITKGIVDSCLHHIHKSNKTHPHINGYLHIDVNEMEDRFNLLLESVTILSKTPYDTDNPAYTEELIRTRLDFAKLCLDAASAACLYAGTKGYMQGASPQRNLREAFFMSVVTPSVKHLSKELDETQNGHRASASKVRWPRPREL